MTSCLRVTTVIGADVSVIAIDRGAGHALILRITGLGPRARIVIGAVAIVIALTPIDVGMETPFFGITGIDGAAIPVITGNGIPRLTYPIHTLVSRGADTPVIAG